MAASLWRVPASKIGKVGSLSFAPDNGLLRPAQLASRSDNYLFSEIGAGVQPLALVGLWSEVLNWLSATPKRGILNQIERHPDICMGLCFHRPGERFKGLFPIHDALQSLIDAATASLPVPTTEAPEDAAPPRRKPPTPRFGSGSTRRDTAAIATTPVVVTFSYLPAADIEWVATRSIMFEALHPIVHRALIAMGRTT